MIFNDKFILELIDILKTSCEENKKSIEALRSTINGQTNKVKKLCSLVDKLTTRQVQLANRTKGD